MATTLAKNTVFKISTTQVTGVTDITWSGRTWKFEDTTNHDASTPVESTQTTIANNGKYTLSLDYNPADTQHIALRALNISGASGSFTVIEPNSGETKAFTGYVGSWASMTPVNGLLKAKCEVTVTGEMTIS